MAEMMSTDDEGGDVTMSQQRGERTRPFRIGMFGAGTVGGGVYQLLHKQESPEDVAAAAAAAAEAAEAASSEAGKGAAGAGAAVAADHEEGSVVISKICVRDINKKRDFVVNTSLTQIVTDPAAILQDKDIDCVVEVMGGTDLAKTVVLEALKAGKSVVTANKALLAENLDELTEACQVAGDYVKLAYEAAVCGGIPIIHVLQSSYAADTIHSVTGVCNGTTNFILCEMAAGRPYETALKQAQDLGYAEADPTADVDGHDVKAKICLLAKLATGVTVPLDGVPCEGIRGIVGADFDQATFCNSTIKLVGTATVSRETNPPSLSVYVSPAMVSKGHMLSGISGAGNAVAVVSQNLGTAAFTGPGAGRSATANSVAADVVRVAARAAAEHPFPLQETMSIESDYRAQFYVRITGGSGENVRVCAERNGVTVHKSLGSQVTPGHYCLITAENSSHSLVKKFLDDLLSTSSVTAAVAMPVISGS